jgi:hypothetical protein
MQGPLCVDGVGVQVPPPTPRTRRSQRFRTPKTGRLVTPWSHAHA